MELSGPRWPAPAAGGTTSAPSAEPAFSPFAISAEQWRTVLTERPNVILVGRYAATEAVLKALEPGLARPVWRCCARSGFALPPIPAAFVLHQLSALSALRQLRLLEWLATVEDDSQVQVVSTTAAPIFPLVERGAFLPDLYFRLNGLTLDLDAPVASGWPSGAFT
jgi:Sigma-54 interaction domain